VACSFHTPQQTPAKRFSAKDSFPDSDNPVWESDGHDLMAAKVRATELLGNPFAKDRPSLKTFLFPPLPAANK
jgi:hypothetical protein